MMAACCGDVSLFRGTTAGRIIKERQKTILLAILADARLSGRILWLLPCGALYRPVLFIHTPQRQCTRINGHVFDLLALCKQRLTNKSKTVNCQKSQASSANKADDNSSIAPSITKFLFLLYL